MNKERYIIRPRRLEMVSDEFSDEEMVKWLLEKFGDDLELYDTLLDEVISISSDRQRLESIIDLARGQVG